MSFFKIVLLCVIIGFVLFLLINLISSIPNIKKHREKKKAAGIYAQRELEKKAEADALYHRLKTSDAVRDMLERIFEDGEPVYIRVGSNGIAWGDGPRRQLPLSLSYESYGYEKLTSTGISLLSDIIAEHASDPYSISGDSDSSAVFLGNQKRLAELRSRAQSQLKNW